MRLVRKTGGQCYLGEVMTLAQPVLAALDADIAGHQVEGFYHLARISLVKDERYLDRFDRVQLEEVVRVCARAKSLSDAGRTLFAASRRQRTSTNDADRLRKYLTRFGLDWERVRAVE